MTRLPWLSLALMCACATPRHTSGPLAVHADPKLIDMTTEPTTSLVLANAFTELGVRVQITAHDAPGANRPPLDLALVLDTSGSMEGNAIDAVKASARKLVERMRDGDRISVIAFHSRADLLVKTTTLDGNSRHRVLDAIDHIVARGTTDLSDGLALGLQQLQEGRFAQGINRIVLLSDGVPNSATQLPGLIAQVHASGYAITTLGMGLDFDPQVMTQIARDTGGTYHYIEQPDEVAGVFDGELAKMTTVIGRNLQLAIRPGPGVTIEPMPGLNLGADGQFYASIGDLPAGETRDLMIPIRVAARGETATVELVDATLTFDDVVAGSGRDERDGYASVKASTNGSAIKSAIKIELEVARIRASAAAAILEAMQLARSGQIDQAKQRIAQALAALKATKLDDPGLAKIGQELEAVAKQIATMTQVVMTRTPAAPRAPVMADEPAAERKMRKVEAEAAATVQGL